MAWAQVVDDALPLMFMAIPLIFMAIMVVLVFYFISKG